MEHAREVLIIQHRAVLNGDPADVLKTLILAVPNPAFKIPCRHSRETGLGNLPAIMPREEAQRQGEKSRRVRSQWSLRT